MKAVYEMPNVHFEIFNANEAVAICIQKAFDFICLSGKNADQSTVIAETGNQYFGSCSSHAGIAWYNGSDAYDDVEDSVNADNNIYATSDLSATATGNQGGVSNSNTSLLSASANHGTATVTVKENMKDDFLGWLYITGFSDGPEGTIGFDSSDYTAGWTVTDTSISFSHSGLDYPSGKNTYHAMIAGIYAITVQAS